MPPETRIIGVDFDNTIVTYDEVMYRVANARGLISIGTPKNKKDIRDHIRLLPGGEDEWTRLQAVVYGPKMPEAQLIPGVRRFFQLCYQSNIKIYIISHKTEYAKFDETGTNLRSAAIEWIKRNGLFNARDIHLSPADVYFGSTREEKIAHIIRLGCTHFIDDLEEVFLNATFPANVEKILFSIDGVANTALQDVKIFDNWKAICGYFFDADC